VLTLSTYEYAYIRVVPRVELGEFFTVGVVLFCRTQRFLQARLVLDVRWLAFLAPQLDLTELQAHLGLIPRICNGEGPIGQLGQAETFHWLVSPHSTVIQTSEVHAGLCSDPAEVLERLTAGLSGVERSESKGD
jgi:hypothetical protein